MTLDDKKKQAIIKKAILDENFSENVIYNTNNIPVSSWSRSLCGIHDYLNVVDEGGGHPLIVFESYFGAHKLQTREFICPESIDIFYYLYIDKNMDFEEIVQKYIKKEEEKYG